MIEDLIRGGLTNNFSIGGYVFDAYLKMTQTNGLTITSHPVMIGANVTDHAYVNPKEFEFEIGVSDTSIGKDINLVGLGQFGFSKIGFGTSRPQKAFQALVTMQESREPVKLKYKYGECDVLIDSITPTDDYTTDSALRVRVHMTEIIITEPVATKTTTANTILNTSSRGQQVSKNITERVKSTWASRGGIF